MRAVKTTALGLAIGLAGAITPVQATDLLELYRIAQQNDPTFAAARQDFEAAEEARPQARAALLPQVRLDASYSSEEIDDSADPQTGVAGDSGQTLQPGDGSGSATSEQFGITLSQTLFNWEEFAGVSRADAEVARAEAEFAAAEQELILRVAEAYFEVLLAEENARFAEAEVEAIERQLEEAQERFEVGLVPITDSKSAQASYDLAVSREIEARNEIDNAREALRTIVDRRVGALAEVQAELPLERPEPDDVGDWVERAREQNPEYLAARSNSEAARQGIRQARSGHYPEVDLVAQSQDTQRDGGSFDTDERVDSIGVEVSLPLFRGGATVSGGREARAEFEAAQSRMVDARRGAEQDTRDAFRNLEARISQVRALRAAVESNETAVESEQAGFEAGTRTAVDVLDALSDQFEAERDFAEARFQYLLERLRLQAATGTLTVDELRTINQSLRADNGD